MTDLFRAFIFIVVGLAGDSEHAALFDKWGTGLVETAEALGIPQDHILHLNENVTRISLERSFSTLAAQVNPDDVVLICLIGHGSFDGRNAKFNLAGPDMTPKDFAALLHTLSTQRIVFVNTASASGPFIDELSGPDRIVITATRSGTERYTTLFPEFFVSSFASEDADTDKNGFVTVLEAFNYAQLKVSLEYEREDLLETEHARMDDPSKVAGTVFFGSFDDNQLPLHPQLQVLHFERLQLEQQIEMLKLLKDSMNTEHYMEQFEQLAVALARKAREIREFSDTQ
tara:strand:+ start:11203 stop:12060 length:858 start_codon:yes stop_codon:yes gene_type:complete